VLTAPAVGVPQDLMTDTPDLPVRVTSTGSPTAQEDLCSSFMSTPNRSPGSGPNAGPHPARGGAGWEPELARCIEDTWHFDVGPGSRVTVSTWFDGPRLVQFAIMHLTLSDDGRMVEITRADSRHGEVHVHSFDRHGAQVGRVTLLGISCPEDVDRGYEVAYSRVIDRWEADRRRWASGR
jgi:hypothetical protein